VPEAAKHGDILCVLGESEIPFVLRPVGAQYKLIGDAYIDVGEDVPDSRRPEVETFVIQ